MDTIVCLTLGKNKDEVLIGVCKKAVFELESEEVTYHTNTVKRSNKWYIKLLVRLIINIA